MILYCRINRRFPGTTGKNASIFGSSVLHNDEKKSFFCLGLSDIR